MGSSGAGKTSMLNILADRINKKAKNIEVSGEIMMNKTTPLTQENFGKVGSYVMQDDVLF